MARSKHPVPKTSLLAVVVRLAPSLAVVDIVVFDDELGVKETQQPREGVWRGGVQTETAMAGQFREHHVLVAYPPVVESHWQAHELHREEGHERDAGNIEEFLLLVRVQREQRVGVLREVVRAVVLPETADVVHQTVVPVEPEVEDDPVQADFEREPEPADCVGRLRRAVREEDCEHWPDRRCGHQRVHHLGHPDVWHLVALVLVSVQEPEDVAQTTHDVDLVDRDELEGGHVEHEGYKRSEVLAGVHHVRLVDGQRDERVHQHPPVQVKVGHMRHFVVLGMHGYRLVQACRMDAQDLIEPVEGRPFIAVDATPGRLHRVVWIARGLLHFDVACNRLCRHLCLQTQNFLSFTHQENMLLKKVNFFRGGARYLALIYLQITGSVHGNHRTAQSSAVLANM